MPDITNLETETPEDTYGLVIHTGVAGALPADNATPRKLYQGDGTELPIAVTAGAAWIAGLRVLTTGNTTAGGNGAADSGQAITLGGDGKLPLAVIPTLSPSNVSGVEKARTVTADDLTFPSEGNTLDLYQGGVIGGQDGRWTIPEAGLGATPTRVTCPPAGVWAIVHNLTAGPLDIVEVASQIGVIGTLGASEAALMLGSAVFVFPGAGLAASVNRVVTSLGDHGFAENFVAPTSDPGVSGAVWNNNGTLAISAG